MFDTQVYNERRNVLKNNFNSGLLLFPGNNESPANYQGNTFEFRQDSTFLYYFGLDIPNLFAVIDIENNSETLFGDDFSVEDIVWMGPQPTISELSEKSGVSNSDTFEQLREKIKNAILQGRRIHFLPQYRTENLILIGDLLGINPERLNDYTSKEFIISVVNQRSIKAPEEIKEIDYAVDIANKMHTAAMKMLKPGVQEKKIAGMIEGVALSLGRGMSFRPIVSKHGETLHNHYHENYLETGDLLVNDSGAETSLYYASDITRTLPVGGKFSQKQKEIYEIVLKAQMSAIEATKPGVTYKELHLLASKIITEGLISLGLMRGNVDDAVTAGAHALFFPHGLGHMMGLDVHDMENLGEKYVGYDESVNRSEQFGLNYLRLAKALKPGFVFTVEPGIYFISQLIDMWKKQDKNSEYINYDKVEDYRGFGGIRIEDNVLVTEDGYRVLGSKPIPKSVEEVESLTSR
jgi:Xaa-Pro aminopeptidase